jgi:hypothetical protein
MEIKIELQYKNGKLNKYVYIKDIDSKIWLLPKFIRRFFIKSYLNQGFVYLECPGEQATFYSNRVKWLEKLKIETYSQKKANKLSWEYFHNEYPEYRQYIQLF